VQATERGDGALADLQGAAAGSSDQPVYEHFGPGPMEAVEQFLKENHAFAVDVSREKLLLTFNPRGWLRKSR
jgi:cephalosporin hydroxylase